MFYKIIPNTGENIIVRTNGDGKIDQSVYESMAHEINNELSAHATDDWQIDLQKIIDGGAGQIWNPVDALIMFPEINWIIAKSLGDYQILKSDEKGTVYRLGARMGRDIPDSKEHMELIVNALNSHAPLVDMLKRAKNMLEGDKYTSDQFEAMINNMNELLEGLI